MIGKLAAALAVVMVMLVGVLGFGRLANSDVQAMVMTSLFFGVIAVGIGLLAWRRRDLAVALIAPFAVVGVGEPGSHRPVRGRGTPRIGNGLAYRTR